MKVTYLGHSGFMVELHDSCLVFDYYRGELPHNCQDLKSKNWYVFSSHSHGDHFNPKIIELMCGYDNVTYVFSKDIERKLKSYKELVAGKSICYMRRDEEIRLNDIEIKTFHSTDKGVAFLVKAEGQLIYHAGDLNWWHWEGESAQYNNDMAARYKREVGKIKESVEDRGGILDVAFVPLDPRLLSAYYMGMKYFLENVKVQKLFPMHFWDEPKVQDKFLVEYQDVIVKNECEFCKLTCDGEVLDFGGSYG